MTEPLAAHFPPPNAVVSSQTPAEKPASAAVEPRTSCLYVPIRVGVAAVRSSYTTERHLTQTLVP